ncbi:hypothetical protein P8V03_18735 [Clostridium sp. A1-XYC3]|uniref:Uncharacterized protein n=1 Tax=Clostridium tanneri TaxID=3037988 RepID=A0ABU4JYB1_9CLOT|nr:hypothetical protein [Clostridium sp. A1-XYC3]MDW8803167.1 hypothetical protein [Clostridium sp. A1-XYC3]
MDIIKLKVVNDEFISYLPLFIYKNHVYIIRQNISNNNQGRNFNTFYDGFYKYNLINNSLELINTSAPIIEYFYDRDCSALYYRAIEEKDGKFYSVFFKLDNDFGTEERLLSVKLQRYVPTSLLTNEEKQIKVDCMIASLELYVLNKDFLVYKIDEINSYDEYYNYLDNCNKFKLFVYDVNEKRNYEVKDNSLFKHGIESIRTFKVNNREYILISSALYNEADKYEYIYNPEKTSCNDVRGAIDSIYLIPLEIFINEIKQDKETLSYQIIETVGQEGIVRFIHTNKNKIYYKVEYFNENISEIAIYDIITKEYERKRFESNWMFSGITLDGSTGYFYDDKLSCYVELSGKSWDNKRAIKIPFNSLNIMEPDIIITEEVNIQDGKLNFYSNIYDRSNGRLMKKIQGKPYVFKEDNILIIC